MKKLITYSTKYYGLIFCSMTLAGCLPLKNNASTSGQLKGYDTEQLARFEQQSGRTVVPQYPELSSPSQYSAERRAVRIAIFIAYDHLDAQDMRDTDKSKQASQWDPWSLDAKKDYGASSYAELLRWFVDGGDSFLKPFQGEPTVRVERLVQGPTTFRTVLKGRGPALAKMQPSMDWEILLHLGVAGSPEFAQAFGEAMADSNIAMLNGHFFPEDAEAAQATAAGNQAVDRRFRDWSAADSDIDQFWSQQKSDIYGPAMEAFKAKAISSRITHRVAVFNGCGSEKIENLVLESTEKMVNSSIEIVGMRGFSNYRHFPGQIGRFLASIVNGEKWTNVISSFKFEDADTADMMQSYTGETKAGNSSPVFRSASIGADGEATAQQPPSQR